MKRMKFQASGGRQIEVHDLLAREGLVVFFRLSHANYLKSKLNGLRIYTETYWSWTKFHLAQIFSPHQSVMLDERSMENCENFEVMMKCQVGEVCRLPTLTVTNEGKDAEDEFNTITFRVELNPKYGKLFLDNDCQHKNLEYSNRLAFLRVLRDTMKPQTERKKLGCEISWLIFDLRRRLRLLRRRGVPTTDSEAAAMDRVSTSLIILDL